jgi:hypothetical protein
MYRNQIQTILSALFAIAALTCAGPAISQIYKTVDEEGNVVFTDIPPREDTQDAEQIVVETPNSFAIEEAIGPREQWVVESEESDEEAAFFYKSLVIASPTADESIRENAGNVSIVAVANPRLQSGHRMRLVMNGTSIQEGSQTRFDLENVDRGTHVVATEIVDDSGNVLIRSTDTTFHLQRYRIPTPRPG